MAPDDSHRVSLLPNHYPKGDTMQVWRLSDLTLGTTATCSE